MLPDAASKEERFEVMGVDRRVADLDGEDAGDLTEGVERRGDTAAAGRGGALRARRREERGATVDEERGPR